MHLNIPKTTIFLKSMSTEYISWFTGEGDYIEGKGNEYSNSPVILGFEIPSALPSHCAGRNRRAKAQSPRGLPLVLLKDLPGVTWMTQDLPGKVQESEEMLLPISCSQKRFWPEPWSAQKTKYPPTEKAYVLYFLTRRKALLHR